jgi:hypothetical protein
MNPGMDPQLIGQIVNGVNGVRLDEEDDEEDDD